MESNVFIISVGPAGAAGSILLARQGARGC
jgi:hypothetical protein